MVGFVIGCVLLIVGIVCLACFTSASIKARRERKAAEQEVSDAEREYREKGIPVPYAWKRNAKVEEERGRGFTALKVASAACIFGAALSIGIGCFYTQDAGEVCVLRNFGGSIAGSTQEPGLHAKAPWQDAIKYDTRNNVVSFIADGEEDYFGGSANGPEVTINDRGGASAKIDVQVNYSLDPGYAERLYAEYGTQENFVRSVVAVDSRAVPREVSGRFDTVSVLTNRSEFTQAIQSELSSKWSGMGLVVEQVSVQEVRYPDSIVDAYAQAQRAEVAKAQAENERERAKVEAETRVIEAQGIADANKVLSESLDDMVIAQNYIDALREIGANGNLVVVPDGSNPLVVAQKGQ